MCCGVYVITNLANGKCYIGSSVEIWSRWACHKCGLKYNRHFNLHLQHAYNKYGEVVFVFEILLYCDKENLLFYENRAIKEFKCLNSEFGYNCKPARRCDLTGSNYEELVKNSVGEKNPFFGKEHTKETRQKMVIAWKNRIPMSVETKQKMSKTHKGTKCLEHSERMKGTGNPASRAVIVNGKYYPTLKEAAKLLGLHRQTIPSRIKANKSDHAWA
jgi:group I intron endonuclease